MLKNNEARDNQTTFELAQQAVRNLLQSDISGEVLLDPVVVKINEKYLTIDQSEVKIEINFRRENNPLFVEYEEKRHAVQPLFNRALDDVIQCLKNDSLNTISEATLIQALQKATTCPITLEFFKQPILLSSGITIDYSSLEKLEKPIICPVTQCALTEENSCANARIEALTKIVLQYYPLDTTAESNALIAERPLHLNFEARFVRGRGIAPVIDVPRRHNTGLIKIGTYMCWIATLIFSGVIIIPQAQHGRTSDIRQNISFLCFSLIFLGGALFVNLIRELALTYPPLETAAATLNQIRTFFTPAPRQPSDENAAIHVMQQALLPLQQV